MLKDIPLEKIKTFEIEFLQELRSSNEELLKQIASGVFNDEIADPLTQAAAIISKKLSK